MTLRKSPATRPAQLTDKLAETAPIAKPIQTQGDVKRASIFDESFAPIGSELRKAATRAYRKR